MSSKPRKPTTVSSVEHNQAKRDQSYMQQTDNEIVNEEEYDDGIDQDENYGDDDVDHDIGDDDDIDDDDVKAAYDRQKTKDIGFELPNDDDDDDSDGDADEDDGIEDDYQDDDQDEDVSEDDEA